MECESDELDNSYGAVNKDEKHYALDFRLDIGDSDDDGELGARNLFPVGPSSTSSPATCCRSFNVRTENAPIASIVPSVAGGIILQFRLVILYSAHKQV